MVKAGKCTIKASYKWKTVLFYEIMINEYLVSKTMFERILVSKIISSWAVNGIILDLTKNSNVQKTFFLMKNIFKSILKIISTEAFLS